MEGGSETTLFPQEAPRWPLPVKRLSLPPSKPQLSEEQAEVLRVVLKGQSIFFTGSAGNVGQSQGKKVVGWDGRDVVLTLPSAQGLGSLIC